MVRFDSLAVVSLAGYAILAAAALAASPREDRASRRQRLLLGAAVLGTALAYLASSAWLFVAGWTLSILPVWLDEAYGGAARRMQALSVAALLLGLSWTGDSGVGFAMLVVAVMLRKGIVPFQGWVAAAFEKGSPTALSLMLNGHLGAYLMLRFVVPQHAEAAAKYLGLLSLLALFTSVWGAMAGLAALPPRRILSLVCVSQTAFILAGLANRNVEGITGALLHWWVVAFATAVLLAVYRALEVRSIETANGAGFRGFGYHAPRLAVFFTVAAVALVGLPGTLGFVAEDLLFHGSLESHPVLGVALPLATALNAITALRLTMTLFAGRRGIHVAPMADALPRERWALTVPVILLVAGGVFPALAVALREPAARDLAKLLGVAE